MKVTFISGDCLLAIKRFEGFRSRAYRCPSGVLTVGFGHTFGVKRHQVVTPQEANQLLLDDLQPVCAHIVSLDVFLTQGMFDALADFIFNVGVVAFDKSTLCRMVLQNSEQRAIADEFRRWVFSRGKVLEGLKKRREWEVERYFSDSLLS